MFIVLRYMCTQECLSFLHMALDSPSPIFPKETQALKHPHPGTQQGMLLQSENTHSLEPTEKLLLFNSLSSHFQEVSFAVYVGKLSLPQTLFTPPSICGTHSALRVFMAHEGSFGVHFHFFFQPKLLIRKPHNEVSL